MPAIYHAHAIKVEMFREKLLTSTNLKNGNKRFWYLIWEQLATYKRLHPLSICSVEKIWKNNKLVSSHMKKSPLQLLPIYFQLSSYKPNRQLSFAHSRGPWHPKGQDISYNTLLAITTPVLQNCFKELLPNSTLGHYQESISSASVKYNVGTGRYKKRKNPFG